ncbi:MAG: RICIN domain-containing protein, partial [Oscillospiraceae bacterium]|nr:RICIN domain-containing protein [Oscillospiraceae bacterium]
VQFEQIVEYLTDYNVDIVVETLILDEQVQAATDCTTYFDMQKLIRKHAPYGTYDTVITFTCENTDFGCPNTSFSTREPMSGAGYAWVPIALFDHESYDPTVKDKPWHLYTVDLAMHEWIHQLESFGNLDGIVMPSADIFGKGTDLLRISSDQRTVTNDQLEWDFIWPEDTVYKNPTDFLKGREPDSVSYARAYFNGHIHDIANDRYLGMFPSFWRVYDGKCFLGEYYANDPDGKYQAFLGEGTAEMSRESAVVYKDDSYIFDMYYSLEENKIMSLSKNHPNWRFPYENTQLKDCTFTKISYGETGDYYLMNQGNGKYLAFDAEKQAFTFSDFKTDDSICWTITYLGDNFVRISPKAAPALRFDVGNAWDEDDNPVIIYVETGVDRAQEYQLRQNADETYSIYPLLSYKRCVTNKSGNIVLAEDKKANVQKWLIEKADGNPITIDPAVTNPPAPVTTVTTTTTTVTTKAPVTTTKAPVTTTKAPVTTTAAPVTTTKAPVTTTVPVQTGLKGDVNLDGSVDVSDAVLTARVLAEDRTAVVKDQGIRNADVNGSGSPDMEDIVLILKYIAKIISSLS